jgi:tetratricopeptide (TPR) repeat protein
MAAMNAASDAVSHALASYHRGDISAEIAVMRVLLALGSEDAALAWLTEAGEIKLLRVAQRHRDGLNGVASLVRAGLTDERSGGIGAIRAQFDEAVALAPRDPEALAAAAVGRFDKADPAAAFGRLGPLTGRFPRAQSPRFHLGLLLLWSGDVEGAKRQLRQARALGPESRLGREAKRFLDRL